MMIFYVDEFGNHRMPKNPKSPTTELTRGANDLFILAAVGIRDNQRKPLAEALIAIKDTHFGDDGDPGDWGSTEIKGRHLRRVSTMVADGRLMGNPSGYRVLDTSAKVDALIADIKMLLIRYRPLIYTVAVDKCELLDLIKVGTGNWVLSDPLGAAYALLEQRIAVTLENQYSGEAAIIVADQQSEHEEYFRSGELNRVRDGMTAALRRPPNVNLVLDKPLWVDTNLSSWDRELLQLPDIAAYSAGWCMKQGAGPTEPFFFWPELRMCLARHWSTGQIEAGGFAVYPKPKTWPRI